MKTQGVLIRNVFDYKTRETWLTVVIKSQDSFLPNKLCVGILLLTLVQQLNIRAVGWCLCDSLFFKGIKKNNTLLLGCNLHTRKFTHLKHTIHWLIMYSQTCNHHCESNLGTFSSSLKETPLAVITHYFPLPLVLRNHPSTSVPIDLPILGTSWQLSCKVFLASCVWYWVSRLLSKSQTLMCIFSNMIMLFPLSAEAHLLAGYRAPLVDQLPWGLLWSSDRVFLPDDHF